MILAIALLVNNLGLFFLEVIGYHVCHSVVMLLDGYYHLCQAILCTVRIVSHRIQFTYTPRHTYGLARVGVVGELVAFVSFLSLSISVFLESIKHLVDVVFIIPKQESNSSTLFTAHGHEHIHSLIDHPKFILGVGIYATISNCLLGIAILYTVVKRGMKLKQRFEQRRTNSKQSIRMKFLLSKSLLVTDTLPIHHSFLQVLNMLLGPILILICGVLLLMLAEPHHIRVIFSRLVDPIICCLLFLSYLFMISAPLREVMHLVLQAQPDGLKSDQIEKKLVASVPGISKIHQLHIWRLSPQKTLATVHVVFNTTENIISKYEDIHFIFQTYLIDHVTIQPEFLLPVTEIEQMGYQHQTPAQQVECSTLQCLADETTNSPESNRRLADRSPFHRRSSFALESDDEPSNTDA